MRRIYSVALVHTDELKLLHPQFLASNAVAFAIAPSTFLVAGKSLDRCEAVTTQPRQYQHG